MAGIEDFKRKILEKKELKNIEPEFLDKIIEEEKKYHKSLFKSLEEKNFNPRSKEFEEFRKAIRKKLRSLYGVFNLKQLSPDKLRKLMEEFRIAHKDENSHLKKEIISKILSNHLSTSERLPNYSEFYQKISEITKKPKKIVDLGCGLNPLSIEFSTLKPHYVASEMSEKDLKLIQEYFKISKIKGKTIKADLTNEPESKRIIEETKDADLVLMLKLADTLDAIKRGTTEKIITEIQSNAIIISVPIYSIGGKNKIKTNRTWLQRILEKKEKQGWERTEYEIGNEHFTALNKQILKN